MACPTCSGTMAVLCVHDVVQYAHCERCGTVKATILNANPGVDNPRVYVPKLVERCRQFGETLGPGWGNLWHRLGIEESINLPENR